jgi:hypothetical protein
VGARDPRVDACVEWITDVKRPETRAKRLATAVEWLAENGRRDWKYEKSWGRCPRPSTQETSGTGPLDCLRGTIRE